MKSISTPPRCSSDSEFLDLVSQCIPFRSASVMVWPWVGAYLNSVSTTIYRDALQTDLRKPSFCASLFRLSSDSPMARTKPLRA